MVDWLARKKDDKVRGRGEEVEKGLGESEGE